MRRGFGSHRAVFVEHPGFHDRQRPFPPDFAADDLHCFSNEHGRAETGFHFSRIGGNSCIQKEIIAHDFVHEGHNQAAVHAVVIALVFMGGGKEGKTGAFD